MILQRGSKGDAVRAFQAVVKGFDPSPALRTPFVDGDFGPRTEAAWIAFQLGALGRRAGVSFVSDEDQKLLGLSGSIFKTGGFTADKPLFSGTGLVTPAGAKLSPSLLAGGAVILIGLALLFRRP